MAIEIKIKPLTVWNGAETKKPKRSAFRQTYLNTKELLQKELSYLDVYDGSVEIEMFLHPNQIRQNGNLRQDARPYKEGVKLNFLLIMSRFVDKNTGKNMCRTKMLTYPCDRFDSWQDNLRAIALSLEALRRVERYGVFKFQDVVARLALSSASGKLSDRDTALHFISEHSGITLQQLGDDSVLKAAYFAAAKKLHPDAGGDGEDFHKLQDAKRILGI